MLIRRVKGPKGSKGQGKLKTAEFDSEVTGFRTVIHPATARWGVQRPNEL